MSHYGTPPPDEADQPGGSQTEPPPDALDAPDAPSAGAHAGEPAPYNPYPDDWEAPRSNSGAFVAKAPDQPDPYGQVNPYGQAAPYAQPGPAANPYASTASPDKPTFGFGGYAGWFTRVGAYLIDAILTSVAGAPAWVGEVMRFQNLHFVHQADGSVTMHTSGTPAAAGLLILLGSLTGLAFLVWNTGFRQGRTGASIGKSVLAIRVVNSAMQPIGPGWSLLRQLVHVLDGLPCFCLPLGYLWPLWDDRKQTFADKIMKSFVIQATTPQPRAY